MTKFSNIVNSFNSFNCITGRKETINIYDLVSKFDDSYIQFLKDCSTLPRLNLGKSLDFNSYSKEDFYETLELTLYGLDENVFGYSDALLLLCHNTSGYYALLRNIPEKGRISSRREFIFMSPELIKTYLEFGRKNKLFIDAFSNLRNATLIDAIGLKIQTSLRKEDGSENGLFFNEDSLSSIDGFTVNIERNKKKETNKFEFVFGLADNLGNVKVNQSVVRSKSVDLSINDVKEIVGNISVNKDLLPQMFNKNKVLERRSEVR